jgi:hypothetical protein
MSAVVSGDTLPLAVDLSEQDHPKGNRNVINGFAPGNKPGGFKPNKKLLFRHVKSLRSLSRHENHVFGLSFRLAFA